MPILDCRVLGLLRHSDDALRAPGQDTFEAREILRIGQWTRAAYDPLVGDEGLDCWVIATRKDLPVKAHAWVTESCWGVRIRR